MTQAFNLSQLANFVNTSGQLNAATGLFNQAPVANGGTGRSTVTTGALLLGAGTSAMTELTGTTPGTVVAASPAGWTSVPAASVAGGNYAMYVYTSPTSYVAPIAVKAIKVTVVGAGGNGGNSGLAPPGGQIGGAGTGGGGGGATIQYISKPVLPASPITITAGAGTNSFGGFCSATAGGAGTAGSSPNQNATVRGVGGVGTVSSPVPSGAASFIGTPGFQVMFDGNLNRSWGGAGGTSAIFAAITPAPTIIGNGATATIYGGGGSGAPYRTAIGTNTAGAGAPGVVIVEEFY